MRWKSQSPKDFVEIFVFDSERRKVKLPLSFQVAAESSGLAKMTATSSIEGGAGSPDSAEKIANLTQPNVQDPALLSSGCDGGSAKKSRTPRWYKRMYPAPAGLGGEPGDKMKAFNLKWDDARFEAWHVKEKARVDARIRGDIVDSTDSEDDFLGDFSAANEDEFRDEDEVDVNVDEVHDEDVNEDHQVCVEDKEAEANKSEVGDGLALLCQFVCDFVYDLPKPSNQSWDRELTDKVLAAWRKCVRVELYYTKNSPIYFRKVREHRVEKYAMDLLPVIDDDNTLRIDLRGQCAEDAKKTLTKHLHRLSRQPQSALFVVVGCIVHGIGEGKLKQSVLSLLTVYEIFKWTEVCGGAIISIKLEDCCGWTPLVIAQEYLADATDQVEEVREKSEMHKAEVDEEASLCSIISDFLCDIPTYQRRDAQVTEKVLAGVKGCYADCFHVFEDEEYMAIDLRGLYSDDAECMLLDHLDKSSSRPTLKFLNVIVGCIVHGHGNGKRNLWRLVLNILLRDETIKWVESKSGDVIRIELDGRKDYSNLRR